MTTTLVWGPSTWASLTEYDVSWADSNTLTKTVSGGQGAVAGAYTGVDTANQGNDRRWFLFPTSPDGYSTDSEIVSLWRPNPSGGTLPGQVGHIHRVQNAGGGSQRGVAVWSNVVFGGWWVVIIGIWAGKDGTATFGDQTSVGFDSFLGQTGDVPYMVRSRLVGANHVDVKVWLPANPEPSWSDPAHTFSADLPLADCPQGKGRNGLIYAHVANHSPGCAIGQVTYSGSEPAPPPPPPQTSTPSNRLFTFTATNVFTAAPIADLPLTGVSFSKVLNGTGQLSGALHIEDPRLQALNWVNATQPNKAAIWVDLDGVLLWGGIITTRRYDAASQTVSIGAVDHCGYLTRRMQAGDYSTMWATTPAGAAQIAWRIITDALAATYSVPIAVPAPAATPPAYQITFAATGTQRQSVDSLVSQLAGLGYLVGFDYCADVSYAGNVPAASITLSYPRRGRLAGSTGLLIDTSTAVDFSWVENGDQQANRVWEMATTGGGAALSGTWSPSLSDGYPLLESSVSHVNMSQTPTSSTVLNAYVSDDLALYAYPPVAPEVTLPLFGHPAPGEWLIGDDVRFVVPKTAGAVSTNPRFPNGVDTYLRIVRADVTVADEGLSTVKFTLNMPPATSPVRPPN